MLEITDKDVIRRLERDNSWWRDPGACYPKARDWPRRNYYPAFAALATARDVRRAVVLMGPRRVGKTVMLTQFILDLLAKSTPPENILYASIDAPVYTGLPLEKFVEILIARDGHQQDAAGFVIFDEIQYLNNWERHLKDLVDAYPRLRFVASGSAAAALKRASTESGAGRFSDFKLPPLTFAEYLLFINQEAELIRTVGSEEPTHETTDIAALNAHFIDYLNYGGYPETVMNETIRSNADQFVRNDIIDKVLLKDLPALYGIQDIQELNKLVSFIALNAGQEISLEAISQKMGISKPTIGRYIEYLESSFLVMKVLRVDSSGARLKRATSFKVYLTNPSMRAAIFAPVDAAETELLGHLVESAIFSQWSHLYRPRLHYARWEKGEIDIVSTSGAGNRADWAVEVKWADDILTQPLKRFAALADYIATKRLVRARVTTRSISGALQLSGVTIPYGPSSLYCYMVGKNLAMQ